MPRFRPKGRLERDAAADLWKHTLSGIPTMYGRFLYLASLRDPNSGIYRHYGLTTVFGREEGTKALRESHEQIFTEWLNLPLLEKHADLMLYFSQLEEPPAVVVDLWLRSQIYVTQVPLSARATEVKLFSRDLEALLKMISSGSTAEAPTRSSKPPR